MRRARCLAAVVVLGLAVVAYGYRFLPTPIAEGVASAEAWVRAHPGNAEGYFFLGRVNGFGVAHGGDKEARMELASLGNGDAAPFFVPWDSLMYVRPADRDVPAEARKYLTASIVAYRRATELDKDNARYQLGFGWALEQASTCRLVPPAGAMAPAKVTAAETALIQTAIGELSAESFLVRNNAAQTLRTHMPAAAEILAATKTEDVEAAAQIDGLFRSYWVGQAVPCYRRAFELTVEKNSKADRYDELADNTISVKAGQRLEVLVPAGVANRTERNRIEAALKAILAKPGMPHAF